MWIIDIDDILKLDKFKDLNKFLTDEMFDVAGNYLVNKMIDVLESEESARHWFYSYIGLWDKRRPYDYCKNGEHSEVERILGRIEHGVF